MLYAVTHSTVYQYSESAALGHNVLHLEPRPHPRQTVQDLALQIDPPSQVTHRRVDYFGNPVCYFSIQQPHRRLCVVARCRVAVTPPAPLEPKDSLPWHEVVLRLRAAADPGERDAYAFVFESPYVPRDSALADYAAESFPPGRPLLAAVQDLTTRIHRDFRYDRRATTVATPMREVLARRAGVCQDFAHLEIGCLRALGLAARYISGYLVTEPPPGEERLIGTDASHAWVSVFCPDLGWIDFDPTNDQMPTDRHITLAWGRDYDDVSPVRGIVLGGGRSTLTVSVDVMPVGNAADLTLPGMS
jgi:transglutaminase-like putative cysteine protease